MTPQVQEPEIVEEMPMTYSLEKSSFGLLLDREGPSSTLLTSIALVSVLLAGTFLIVMETGRTARAPYKAQANASAATSAAPAMKQVADLKTVDLDAKPTQAPAVPAVANMTPAHVVTTPAKAQVTSPAKPEVLPQAKTQVAATVAAHTAVTPAPALQNRRSSN